MNRYTMVTAFGRDQPGIVAALAEGLYQLGCNLEDSCMTRLRGEFSMMLLVRLPDGLTGDQLIQGLSPFTSPLNLSVMCREIPREEAEAQVGGEAGLFMLSVYGADHPGIVAPVARTIADHGGNITDVNTRVVGAEGRPVYVMVLEVQLPDPAASEGLHQALDRLKPALGVDLTFRPIESVQL